MPTSGAVSLSGNIGREYKNATTNATTKMSDLYGGTNGNPFIPASGPISLGKLRGTRYQTNPGPNYVASSGGRKETWDSFTVPVGHEAIWIELAGAGGGGGGYYYNYVDKKTTYTYEGGGGGGGTLAVHDTSTNLIPGDSYTFQIGTGGAGGQGTGDGTAGGGSVLIKSGSPWMTAPGGSQGTPVQPGAGGGASTGSGVTYYVAGNAAIGSTGGGVGLYSTGGGSLAVGVAEEGVKGGGGSGSTANGGNGSSGGNGWYYFMYTWDPMYAGGQKIIAYSAGSSGAFQVPDGITKLYVIMSGGGGGGGGGSGYGAGSAGSAGNFGTYTLTVSPGQSIGYSQAAGGEGGSNGINNCGGDGYNWVIFSNVGNARKGRGGFGYNNGLTGTGSGCLYSGYPTGGWSGGGGGSSSITVGATTYVVAGGTGGDGGIYYTGGGHGTGGAGGGSSGNSGGAPGGSGSSAGYYPNYAANGAPGYIIFQWGY